MTISNRSEQSRHKSIDRTLQTAVTLLNLDVLKGLGPHPGRFIDILASTYVPNRRGDRLVTPKKYQNGTSIPVYALEPGETVLASGHMATMHDEQRAQLEQFAQTNATTTNAEDIDVADVADTTQRALSRSFTRNPRLALLNERGDQVMSRTTDISAEISIGSLDLVARARPIVLLSTVPTHSIRSGALEFLHQTSHVDQRLHRGPRLTGDTYRDIERQEEEAKARDFESRVARLSLKHLGRQR